MLRRPAGCLRLQFSSGSALQDFIDSRRPSEDLFGCKSIPKDIAGGKGLCGYDRVSRDLDAVVTVSTLSFPGPTVVHLELVSEKEGIRLRV